MEKLTPDQFLQKIIDLAIVILRALGDKWSMLAAAALSVFGVSAFWWWWSTVKKKAARDETERKRKEAEAKNPGENAEAERDGKKAADEIEEIIHEREGRQ